MSGVSSAAQARGLPRVVLLVLWATCVYGLLEILLTAGYWVHSQHIKQHPSCQPDNEGQYSIGVYRGPSPFALAPVEQWRPRANTPSAWPVANPVFTCADVHDVPASFTADPFIYPETADKIYLFFESKSLHNMQGDIGAAVSEDGGMTFKHIGIVLDEPWHLSYPFVFKHEGKMYLMPEGSKSGQLKLYTTSTFPSGWTLDTVLVEAPLVDASLVPPTPGVASSDGRWYMFASNARRKSSKRCREMEIWQADSLKGPWSLHPESPVREWTQGSRSAGRPFVVAGKLYRLGQDCEAMYGYRVRLFHVIALNATHYQEEEVPLTFDPRGGRQGEAAWNGVRYHHMDAQQLPGSDTWLAVMDGDRYVNDYLTHRTLSRLAFLLPSAVVIAIITGYAFWAGGWRAAYGPCLSPLTSWLPGGGCLPCMGGALRACIPRPLFVRLVGGPGEFGGGCEERANKSPEDSAEAGAGMTRKALRITKEDASGKPASGGLRDTCANVDTSLATARPWLCGLSAYRTLGVLVLLALLGAIAAWLLFTFGRMQILAFILWYLRAWGGPADAIRVDGQFSKFSIIVMSYEARTVTLSAFIQHYQHCPSVGEIVVVWNKGQAPRPGRDYVSQVPVRFRYEQKNSMNNRFQPDLELMNRGILMLDDDILMPCYDIERGFARWRQHPERITGFYPRILEGEVPQYLCTQCERHTYASGHYNVILAGASFMDRELVFELYSAPENKEGRDYVDRVFNCDDLLLNYLMAARLKGAQYVEWVRPTKRFDVGKLTSKRLSTGNFGPVRHNCTRDFAAMFGNPLKGRAYPLNFEHMGKPWCPTGIGCMFI